MEKLQQVSEQLSKIVEENDVAAIIILHQPGAALTTVHLSPSYSLATATGPCDSTMIEITTKDVPPEQIKEKVLKTANMFAHLGDACKRNSAMCLDVMSGLISEFKKPDA